MTITPFLTLRRITLCAAVLVFPGCSATPEKTAPSPAKADFNEIKKLAEDAYLAGDWRAATPHYEDLVRAQPQDSALWFRLGNAYARSERPDAAVVAYREALVRDASSGKIWFNMAVVQLRQAASSLVNMNQHLDSDDPLAAKGERAFAMIMEILGEQSTQSTAAAVNIAPSSDMSTSTGLGEAGGEMQPVANDLGQADGGTSGPAATAVDDTPVLAPDDDDVGGARDVAE